jgi:hypothetical protein
MQSTAYRGIGMINSKFINNNCRDDGSDGHVGTKTLALWLMVKLMAEGTPKREAENRAAALMGVSGRSVHNWHRQYRQNGELQPSRRGQYAKVQWLLEDVEMQNKAKKWVRSHSRRTGEKNMIVADFQKYLNEKLLTKILKERKRASDEKKKADGDDDADDESEDEEEESEEEKKESKEPEERKDKEEKKEEEQKNDETVGISESTALRYLHRLGFRTENSKKTFYCDGHQRDDVMAYRQNVYLPKMKELSKWTMHSAPPLDEQQRLAALPLAKRPLVLVDQDESVFHAKDGQSVSWVDDTMPKHNHRAVGSRS